MRKTTWHSHVTEGKKKEWITVWHTPSLQIQQTPQEKKTLKTHTTTFSPKCYQTRAKGTLNPCHRWLTTGKIVLKAQGKDIQCVSNKGTNWFLLAQPRQSKMRSQKNYYFSSYLNLEETTSELNTIYKTVIFSSSNPPARDTDTSLWALTQARVEGVTSRRGEKHWAAHVYINIKALLPAIVSESKA